MSYNYKKNMKKPISKLRLVNDYKEYYVLQFKTAGWFTRWITVTQYTPTISRSHKPGDSLSYGKWGNRWWRIDSNKYGEKLQKELCDSLKTVGDIYRKFIEPDENRMKYDYKMYEDYMDKLNSVKELNSVNEVFE